MVQNHAKMQMPCSSPMQKTIYIIGFNLISILYVSRVHKDVPEKGNDSGYSVVQKNKALNKRVKWG